MEGVGLHGPNAGSRADVEHGLGVVEGGQMQLVAVQQQRHVVAGGQVRSRDRSGSTGKGCVLQVQRVVLPLVVGSPAGVRPYSVVGRTRRTSIRHPCSSGMSGRVPCDNERWRSSGWRSTPRQIHWLGSAWASRLEVGVRAQTCRRIRSRPHRALRMRHPVLVDCRQSRYGSRLDAQEALTTSIGACSVVWPAPAVAPGAGEDGARGEDAAAAGEAAAGEAAFAAVVSLGDAGWLMSPFARGRVMMEIKRRFCLGCASHAPQRVGVGGV